MTMQQIITSIQENGASWFVIVLIFTTFIQISPIKINPWDNILGWLGRSFTKQIGDRLDNVSKELLAVKESVETVNNKLNEHIYSEDEDKAKRKRYKILAFANSLVKNESHTLEEHADMLRVCDEYDEYCREHDGFKNSVAEESIKLIKEKYEQSLREGRII